jgi:hypothetical protein
MNSSIDRPNEGVGVVQGEGDERDEELWDGFIRALEQGDSRADEDPNWHVREYEPQHAER